MRLHRYWVSGREALAGWVEELGGDGGVETGPVRILARLGETNSRRCELESRPKRRARIDSEPRCTANDLTRFDIRASPVSSSELSLRLHLARTNASRPSQHDCAICVRRLISPARRQKLERKGGIYGPITSHLVSLCVCEARLGQRRGELVGVVDLCQGLCGAFCVRLLLVLVRILFILALALFAFGVPVAAKSRREGRKCQLIDALGVEAARLRPR